MFDFRRITLFCLEKRLSKHKMTRFSKNLRGTMATLPPLATPMLFTVGKLTGFTAKLAFHENQGSVNDMV